jgi:hypothetical protein
VKTVEPRSNKEDVEVKFHEKKKKKEDDEKKRKNKKLELTNG